MTNNQPRLLQLARACDQFAVGGAVAAVIARCGRFVPEPKDEVEFKFDEDACKRGHTHEQTSGLAAMEISRLDAVSRGQIGLGVISVSL